MPWADRTALPSVRRAGCRARLLLWGLFLGGAAAVLAPVGPGAFVPLKLAIASADSVGNDVYVAVVVDFGSGSSISSVSKCVPVASNAHDSDALAAAVGAGNVAYSNSGLLCSIDNYPVNGVQNCGQSVGSGEFDYWSYWHGASGSWVYANDGPAEHSVASQGNDVEGWRFQIDQPANSSDPPPGVAPSYAQICNASTEVPPAQTPPAAATPPTTATPRLRPWRRLRGGQAQAQVPVWPRRRPPRPAHGQRQVSRPRRQRPRGVRPRPRPAPGAPLQAAAPAVPGVPVVPAVPRDRRAPTGPSRRAPRPAIRVEAPRAMSSR